MRNEDNCTKPNNTGRIEDNIVRKKEKEKKRTEEKLKALGPLKLTVTLTDYLKSPCVDLHTPVVTYLESFCQTLAVEKDDVSRVDEQNPDSLTLTDLDSGDIRPMDHHVWDWEVDQWLDDLIEVLEEDTMDGHDLLENMTPEEWGHVIEDVLDSFDLDLL